MKWTEFRCGICEEFFILDHLAFTYMVDDRREGVCGFCAAGQEC